MQVTGFQPGLCLFGGDCWRGLWLLVVFTFAFGEVAGVMDFLVDGFGVVDGSAVLALCASLFVVYDGPGHA
jgi:hypothetical protein